MATILIVDDHAASREYLATLLQYFGHRVVDAANGIEALARVRAELPDLVISDIVMPGMGGPEFVKRMRADHPEAAAVPVLFFTASYRDKEAHAMARACNVPDVLLKPAEPGVVMEAVARALKSAAPAAPGGGEADSLVLAQKLSSEMAKLETVGGRLAALIETGLELSGRRSPEDVVDVLARAACVMTGSEWAATGLLGPGGGEVRCAATARRDGTSAKPSPWPSAGSGVPGLVLRTRAPVRCPGGAAEVASLGLAPAAPLGALLAVPIVFGTGRPDIGWIAIVQPAGADGYHDGDERLLITLAAQAALALENLRLLGEATERAHALEAAGAATRRTEDALRTSEAKFLQAQKMEAVGRLAGGVAHDFNNLLTVILGFADLASMKLRAEDPVLHHIGEMRKAAQAAADLTRQLLMFSRRSELAPEVLDLGSTVRTYHAMLRRVVGESIELRLDLDPASRTTRADRSALGQVLMNLVVNARDAMPRGGRLTIRTGAADVPIGGREGDDTPAGNWVTLEVEDSGTGMDEATKARIFEPFFTTKAEGKGTGLGLATVFGIVTQSGGHVSVRSSPGAGSTFRILLPASTEASAAEAAAPKRSEDSPGARRVLVVEDDPTVLGVARQVLEHLGFRVIGALSAEEALRAVDATTARLDLLVTDVRMPGLDGIALAHRMRATHPGLPVVLVSGYPAPAEAATGVAGEPFAFLPKPFSPEDLDRAIRGVLDRPAGA